MAESLVFTFAQGESVAIPLIAYEDAEGETVRDLTGIAIAARAMAPDPTVSTRVISTIDGTGRRETVTERSLFSLTVERFDDPSGEIVVSIPAKTTAGMRPGDWVFDVAFVRRYS